MELSTQIPMASYFIYRSNVESDPTSSLEFCPPKDSDELFFALKTAYPLVKTHSERMRNAVIEFLIKERDEEQTKNQMAAPVFPVAPTLPQESIVESPWSSWPSMSSNSTLSSPDMVNFATPASMSPYLGRTPAMTRQNSQAQSNKSNNPPGLEQLTGVFSLSSNPQPKTRVRRKMTEAEKNEYRKRRIVKACDACSKRKRKCNHNQPQMEKVSPSSRVTKNKAPARGTDPSQVGKAIFEHVESSEFSNDPFSFLEEDLFNELPTNNENQWLFSNNFEDLFTPQVLRQPEQLPSSVWPWSDTPDWTLMDTPALTESAYSPVLTGATSSPSYGIPLFPRSPGLQSPSENPLLDIGQDEPQKIPLQDIARTHRQSPTRTWRNFSDFSRTAFSTADGLDGKEMPLAYSTHGLSATGNSGLPIQLRHLPSTSETLTGIKFNTGSCSVSEHSTLQTDNLNAVQVLDRETGTAMAGSSANISGERGGGSISRGNPAHKGLTADCSATHLQAGNDDSRARQDLAIAQVIGNTVQSTVSNGGEVQSKTPSQHVCHKNRNVTSGPAQVASGSSAVLNNPPCMTSSDGTQTVTTPRDSLTPTQQSSSVSRAASAASPQGVPTRVLDDQSSTTSDGTCAGSTSPLIGSGASRQETLSFTDHGGTSMQSSSIWAHLLETGDPHRLTSVIASHPSNIDVVMAAFAAELCAARQMIMSILMQALSTMTITAHPPATFRSQHTRTPRVLVAV